MLLVTVFHATFITNAAFEPGAGVWPEINEALIPIRMPLFFFVAGLLAASAIRQPLALTRRRTVGYAYLYVLWSLIQLAFDLTLTAIRGGQPPSVAHVLVSLALPTGLWFLWALAAYFLAARLLVVVLGRYAAWGALVALLLSSMLPVVDRHTQGIIDPFFGVGFFGSVAANFVWFYVALFARRWAFALAQKPSWPKALGGSAVYVGLYLLARQVDLAYEARWFLSIAALWAALHLLFLVRPDAWAARLVAAVGRRTLPVYVMQWAALFVLNLLVIDLPLLPALGRVLPVDVAASLAGPVLAAVVAGATWWLGGVISRSRFRALLEAPTWLVGSPSAVQAKSAASSSPST
jgi:surface polysaccharide O-acyltransferase-like enzyme